MNISEIIPLIANYGIPAVFSVIFLYFFYKFVIKGFSEIQQSLHELQKILKELNETIIDLRRSNDKETQMLETFRENSYQKLNVLTTKTEQIGNSHIEMASAISETLHSIENLARSIEEISQQFIKIDTELKMKERLIK